MKEKQLTIITWVILILVILAGGGVGYYFHFVQLAAMRQEAATLADAVAAARAKVAKIEGLRKEKKKLTDDASILRLRIPDMSRLEYDKFANLLDSKREEAGVFIPGANWVPAGKSAPLPGRGKRTLPETMNKVQYNVNVEGDFYQLLRYVSVLEELPRFIGIERFAITPSGGTTDGGTLLRNMSLTLYSFTYKPEKEDVPTIDVDEDRLKGKTTAPPE